ncbi:MAG: hypothetical protein JST59_00550 [Actinobacteria bacterium]|nr:hypothetical protein [Actinomycetota bacterium]
MILQVKCLVDLPFTLTVKSASGESETIPNRHYVQFESQLREPPIFADMKLEKEE